MTLWHVQLCMGRTDVVQPDQFANVTHFKCVA
jgi:hypothetical protein